MSGTSAVQWQKVALANQFFMSSWIFSHHFFTTYTVQNDPIVMVLVSIFSFLFIFVFPKLLFEKIAHPLHRIPVSKINLQQLRSIFFKQNSQKTYDFLSFVDVLLFANAFCYYFHKPHYSFL